jgi:hypothetical protein
LELGYFLVAGLGNGIGVFPRDPGMLQGLVRIIPVPGFVLAEALDEIFLKGGELGAEIKWSLGP